MERTSRNETTDPLPGPPLGHVPPKQFHTRVVWLGLVQLVVGLLILFTGILDLAFSLVAFDVFYLAKVGAGVWIGIVVISTGCVGVVTSRSQLRRHTALLLFLCMSIISMILSVVLLSFAIAELTTGAHTEGMLQQKQISEGVTNNTRCFNVSSSDRCISSTTFDQKIASGTMFIIFSLAELLLVFYSILITKEIIEKEFGKWNFFRPRAANHTPTVDRDVPLPGVSVTEYFDIKENDGGGIAGPYTHSDEHHSTTLHGSSRASFQRHMQNQSVSSREFPDSDQFRAHLEVINNEF